MIRIAAACAGLMALISSSSADQYYLKPSSTTSAIFSYIGPGPDCFHTTVTYPPISTMLIPGKGTLGTSEVLVTILRGRH